MMDSALLDMMDTEVSFMPRGAPGMEGQVNYGDPTTPVRCAIDWAKAQRTATDPRTERIGPSGTIFIDGGDFDPDLVSAGSLVILPDGQQQAVNTIQSFRDPDDSNVIDHWELGF